MSDDETMRLWDALPPRNQQMFGSPEALMANPDAVKVARRMADLVEPTATDPYDLVVLGPTDETPEWLAVAEWFAGDAREHDTEDARTCPVCYGRAEDLIAQLADAGFRIVSVDPEDGE